MLRTEPFLRSDKGAALVEHGVILALVLVAAAAAVPRLGAGVANRLDAAARAVAVTGSEDSPPARPPESSATDRTQGDRGHPGGKPDCPGRSCEAPGHARTDARRGR